jgi:OFA family oxalate/formate antiporter-like MFS transporter
MGTPDRTSDDLASRRALAPASWLHNPWVQLAAGIVGMVAITNLQYGWTFFVEPIRRAFGSEGIPFDKAPIQVAFTLFVVAETWLVPVEGYLVDRFGPRPLVALGGVFAALGWVINSWADSLALLYLGSTVAGVGAGIVYGASMGNALKWFPHRRGLAAGLTAAAFGAGSALTVQPLVALIRDAGYQAAFFWFGLAQGAVVLGCAFVLRLPPDVVAGQTPARLVVQTSRRDLGWQEVIRSPLFWLMYLMFVMVALGGLMTVAELAPIATAFGVADSPVNLFGWTVTALVAASIIDRILNGLTRPFFGWVSDHLGRENTMFIAFSLEGAAILLLLRFAHIPELFVILTGLTFFAWGEVFSLFPALSADLFGRKFATTNYGLLYTAKGTAALLVPLASVLHDACDSWHPVFLIAGVLNWVTALLAIAVLKPMARRFR